MAEHKRRLDRIESFNDAMVPTRGWKWHHTLMLLVYTVAVGALATTLGGTFVSSLYGVSPGPGMDGVALGGGASGEEPAVLVLADEAGSHVHVRASPENSATLLVGDDGGVLVGGDCGHMQVLDREDFLPARMCSNEGVLTLTGAGGGPNAAPAGRRLREPSAGGGGLIGGGGVRGGAPAGRRVLQEDQGDEDGAARAALRVDGLLEVASGLTVFAEPLEVVGMFRVQPAQRHVTIGSPNRELPPSTVNIYGSITSNRLTVDGSTFLRGPLELSRGNLVVEQQANLGRLAVTGQSTMRGHVQIGDTLGDRLSIDSETEIRGLTKLRADVIIGADAPSGRRAMQGTGDDPPPEPTVEIFSEATFRHNVTLAEDINVQGDFMTPVFNTKTGVRMVQMPPPPPVVNPDFLHFPCRWDEAVRVCLNVSLLLAPPPINTSNATVDIGTDPLCEDDLNGTLASLGYDCSTAIAATDCSFDMSTNAPEIPPGTFIRDLCPVSCFNCACRPPWCIDEAEQARRNAAALAASLAAANRTINATAERERLWSMLTSELVTLHDAPASRFQVLDFRNVSRGDMWQRDGDMLRNMGHEMILEYRIVPTIDTESETPAQLLARFALQLTMARLLHNETTEVELLVCPPPPPPPLLLLPLGNATNATNTTNATNATNVTGAGTPTSPSPVPVVQNATNSTNTTNATTGTGTATLSARQEINQTCPSEFGACVSDDACEAELDYITGPDSVDDFHPETAGMLAVRLCTDRHLMQEQCPNKYQSCAQSDMCSAQLNQFVRADVTGSERILDWQANPGLAAPGLMPLLICVAESATGGGSTCNVAVPYEEIYPPGPPPDPVFEPRTMTDVFLTGDTSVTRSFNASAEVSLGGPRCIRDGVEYQCVVNVVAPAQLTQTLSVTGHTDVSSATAQTIESDEIKWGTGTADSLILGGTLEDIPTVYAYQPLMSVGGAMFLGNVRIGSRSINRHTISGDVLLAGKLTAQGDVVLGTPGYGHTTNIYSSTVLHNTLVVSGDISLSHTTVSELVVRGYALVQGPAELQGNVVLGQGSTNTLTVKGSSTLQGAAVLRDDLTVLGDVVVGDSAARSLSVLSAVNLFAGLEMAGDLVIGTEPADFTYFYESTAPPPPELRVEYGFRTCIANISGVGYACGRCDIVSNAWQVVEDENTTVTATLSNCFDATVVPAEATCTGTSTLVPDACDATDPSADASVQASCEAAIGPGSVDHTLDCVLMGTSVCTFTPWSQPNCEVAFQLAADDSAASCPLGCNFTAEVSAPLADVTFTPDMVTVTVPSDGMGTPEATDSYWFNASFVAEPSRIALDLNTIPGFRANREVYGFITDATPIPPPPPKVNLIHQHTTITDDLNVYGSTFMQNLSATNVYFPLGARIGTPGGPQEKVELYGDTTVIGAFSVDHDVALAANGHSQVTIGSETTVNADFSASGTIDLGPTTMDQAHVEGSTQIDGTVTMNDDVTLGSLGTHQISVVGQASFAETVDISGAEFSVARNTQLGSSRNDRLEVNASAKMYSGLVVHGDVLLDPENTGTLTIGAPTTMGSALVVAGNATIGTAPVTDMWGAVLEAGTVTEVMSESIFHGPIRLKDTIVTEKDLTIIDGGCRYNCIQEVSVNAQTGSMSMTGDLVVGGVLNPTTVLEVGSQMNVNVIRERGSNVGVTVEGITIIDGGFERANVDTLEEFTLNHGIDIEGILHRDGVIMLESQLPGLSSKGELDVLTLTNSGNSDDMDNTQTNILFRQFYYDPAIVPSSDPAMDAINAKESGKLLVGTSSDWTQVAATRDSYMAFHVAEDGVVYERMRVNSDGDITMPGTDGTSNIVLSAQSGDVSSTGSINLLNDGGIFFKDGGSCSDPAYTTEATCTFHLGTWTFANLYAMELLPDLSMKMSSINDGGTMIMDMGTTGDFTIVAGTVTFDIHEELNLAADLRINGVTRFAPDPEAFALEQRTNDFHLTSGGSCSDPALTTEATCTGTWTRAGEFFADVLRSTFTGDMVLQADPTGAHSAALSLSDSQTSFQLIRDAPTGLLKLQYDEFAPNVHGLNPPFADIATFDGSGSFTLTTGSFIVGDMFRVDVATEQTTARGQINIKSTDDANQATVLLNSAATPELVISTHSAVGTVILNPGGTTGFLKVRDVFSVQGSDGATDIAGNVRVGGLTAPGAAASLTVSSGNIAEKAELVLSDGTDSFDMVKLNRNTVPYLTLTSSDVAGVIDVAPGETTGEFRVNFDRMVVDSNTGSVTTRGDLTLGGVVSGYCADDVTTARTMDCIFPFKHNGASISACAAAASVGLGGGGSYCATKVDELGEHTSLGDSCRVCAEGPRTLSVESRDSRAVLALSGQHNSDTHGEIQFGLRIAPAHGITSAGDLLDISASASAGSVQISPGAAGSMSVFGDKFRISGPDADVVGHGTWSVGEMGENGAANLHVVSPDAAATFTVNAAAASQPASAVFESAGSHQLTISQTDAAAAVAGSGTIQMSSTGGLLLSSDVASNSALIFDSSASAAAGSLVTGSQKATLSMAAADFQLAVQSGDILLSAATLSLSVDKFTVDGASGDTHVAGLLSVGVPGSIGGSASAVLRLDNSLNAFTVTATNDLTISSVTADADVWIQPGTSTGQFKIGNDFFVTSSSGNVVTRGDLLVGDASADHISTEVTTGLPAGSATLAIAAATATGPSVLRLGKSGSSTFEITQTNGLLSIASTDNAGTCQVAAAAVAMNIVAGGALALNTDEFTVTDGVGAFAGDLTVGGAAGLAGARQLHVEAGIAAATVRVAAGAGTDAKLLLTAADGSTAGAHLVQNGAALTIAALDSAGTITVSPGSDAAATLLVTSDTKVEAGTNKIHLGVATAADGAVMTLSDATGSLSTVTQLTDTLTLSCVDGSDGAVNVEAGDAVRLNTDGLVVYAAGAVASAGETHTAGDLKVGGSASAGAGTRALTVQSDDADAQLLLQPSSGGAATMVFGSDAVNTFTVSKVGDVLTTTAAGTSTDIDFVPGGSLTVGGSSIFSVAAATGNVATAGDATIGCSACAGIRTLTVASSDQHIFFALSPQSQFKDVTVSLGTAGNKFDIKQTMHKIQLTAASADATLELLPDGVGSSMSIGDNKFVVDVADGSARARGNLVVGGITAADAGARESSTVSYDGDATHTLSSGPGATATLTLGERNGAETFALQRVGTALSLAAAGTTTGTLTIDPGSAGSVLLGLQGDGVTPVLLLDLGTPHLTMRGDLTVGGSAASGDRALALESTDGAVALSGSGSTAAALTLASTAVGADTTVTFSAEDEAALTLRADGTGGSALTVASVGGLATLSITPGNQNFAATLALGTATEGIEMTAAATTVTMAHKHTSGIIAINPGTTGAGKLDVASGLLTVSPAVGASGTVAISGDLTVGGSFTLETLALGRDVGTGSTGQTINKPTGKLTSSASTLGRIDDPSVITVPFETLTLSNNLVTADSVVVASVISQCNVDTVVLITKITTTGTAGAGDGQVVFTMSNVGIADCANEAYTVSFAVLNQ